MEVRKTKNQAVQSVGKRGNKQKMEDSFWMTRNK